MATIRTAPAQEVTTDGGVSLGAVQARTQAATSQRPPSGMFVLTHHPYSGWSLVDGKVRPDLRRRDLSPGINGATQESVFPAIVGFREKGLTVLENTAEYVVKAPVPGGVHHHFRWERLIPGSTGARPDVDGYAAWLDTLVTRGIIAKPTPDALFALADRLRRDKASAADIAIVEAELETADNATLAVSDGVGLV